MKQEPVFNMAEGFPIPRFSQLHQHIEDKSGQSPSAFPNVSNQFRAADEAMSPSSPSQHPSPHVSSPKADSDANSLYYGDLAEFHDLLGHIESDQDPPREDYAESTLADQATPGQSNAPAMDVEMHLSTLAEPYLRSEPMYTLSTFSELLPLVNDSVMMPSDTLPLNPVWLDASPTSSQIRNSTLMGPPQHATPLNPNRSPEIKSSQVEYPFNPSLAQQIVSWSPLPVPQAPVHPPSSMLPSMVASTDLQNEFPLGTGLWSMPGLREASPLDSRFFNEFHSISSLDRLNRSDSCISLENLSGFNPNQDWNLFSFEP
jgi:hypothetical protein